MKDFKNLGVREKVVVAISAVWTVIGFIFSVFIVNDSQHNSSLTFLAALLIFTAPVWLYWTGVWIWGSGYLMRFVKLITVQPVKKVIHYLRSVSRASWAYIITFGIAFYITSYIAKSSEIAGEIIGEVLGAYIGVLILCKVISKYTRHNLEKSSLKLPLLLVAFCIVLPGKYNDYVERKKESEQITLELSSLANDSSQLPVINSSDSKSLKFVKMMKIERYNNDKKLVDLLGALYPESMEKLLTPTTIKNKQLINHYIGVLDEKISAVEPARREIDEIFAGMPNRYRKIIDEVGGFSKSWVDSFMLNVDQGAAKTKPINVEMLNLIENELFLIKEILVFFRDRHGRFVLKGDQYLFATTAEADAYNSYMKALQDYVKEEERIQKKFTDVEAERQANLKNSSD